MYINTFFFIPRSFREFEKSRVIKTLTKSSVLTTEYIPFTFCNSSYMDYSYKNKTLLRYDLRQTLSL